MSDFHKYKCIHCGMTFATQTWLDEHVILRHLDLGASHDPTVWPVTNPAVHPDTNAGVHQFKMYHREDFNSSYEFRIDGATDARLAFAHAGTVRTNDRNYQRFKHGFKSGLVELPALIMTVDFNRVVNDSSASTSVRVWCQTDDFQGPNAGRATPAWEIFSDVFFDEPGGECITRKVRVWVPIPAQPVHVWHFSDIMAT